MLIRAHDADHGDQWRAFVADQAFGHFIASGSGHSLPVVVPTQFILDSDHVRFHLARANPVFERLRESPHAMLSIAGDWAYIPAAWKAIGDEDPTLGIPTTYYGAVQLIGTAIVDEGAEGIASTLRAQLADLEPESGAADPTVHEKKFATIAAIELQIDEVRAKFKYGGNVDTQHRDAIRDRLRARGGPSDEAAAGRVPK